MRSSQEPVAAGCDFSLAHYRDLLEGARAGGYRFAFFDRRPEPGDLLLTGTPWGCGEFMDPRRSLAPGDEVVVFAAGIGELRNPVVAA